MVDERETRTDGAGRRWTLGPLQVWLILAGVVLAMIWGLVMPWLG